MNPVTVYIASPYSKGNSVTNIRRSFLAAEDLIEKGFLPFCPLLCHVWDIASPHPEQYWFDYDLKWLLKCDFVLRLVGESRGADAEIIEAHKAGIAVFYSLDEFYRHFR